ncbi:MAG: MPT-synthase sulfurylase [Halobacteriovorax sp.]|nr:MPT-synthase sulfurylase [Halobacteriovorax sp.]|tara:strand:- start:7332 stop:7844 length:513 start_codon:yes stop_codon:yes gene_type:complete
MNRLISITILGVFALSCINPQSAAKNKRKSVEVMASQIANKFSDVPQVSIEEYLKWKSEGTELVLVDVRPIEERRVSIIPGAISSKEFESHSTKYQNKKVVAYCTIGYRSSEYVRKLKKKNIEAFNLKESLLGWAHRGLKFEVNGVETNKAHVYEEAWNFLPTGYEGVFE